jgi:hypothetical protein
MQRFIDTILRRQRPEPAIPHCPEHGIEMRLRGKMGRPARFSDQTEEEYTLIYFCPAPDCGQTATVDRKRSQIPVPGAPQSRPDYARYSDGA